MTIQLRVTYEGPVPLVTVAGVLDAAGLAQRSAALAAIATAGYRRLVVDLDQATIGGPDPLRALLRAVAANPSTVHLVARRNSTLAVLVSSRVHHHAAVHPNRADAFAAIRALRGGR